MKYIVLILLVVSSFSLSGMCPKDTVKASHRVSFKDSLDGAFDVSDFLATKKGFIVIPGIITNPAVGYGGYGSVLFIHSSFAESKGFPTITGVMGGGTENGTWLAGVYHMQSWKKDRLRFTGFAGYTDVNLRFYGRGFTDLLQQYKVMLNMQAWAVLSDLSYRISDSPFFVGARYVFVNNDSKFSPSFDLIKEDYKSTVSELGVVFSYDTRNNFFSPTKGIKGEINYQYSGTWLGADNNYSRLYSYMFGYIPINRKNIIGLRGEYDVAFSGVPFYMEPFVTLRGVGLMRYQDEQVFEVETEYQFPIYKRWSGVAFAGVGDAWGTSSSFFEDDIVVSGGFGFRYRIARKFGMNMGIDFAWSSDSFAFSIVFGSAWLRN
ncbi:outer membrane protein assembly factor [Halosquirtibacter xylanolyticus]|uniref:BamA/TamA family outer membrane protein n=1 Tax=Halosquirtibacter xylanolyticus TaxID=3374599 RepID=UPI003749709D|nr:outer membrane protein assembly factor [Prolixibacteraceae bacterium]